MAGSFGYEAEHLSMSEAIADILADQVDGRPGTLVAPGASCRTQIEDFVAEDRPPHPIELIDRALDADDS
jgi:Fe-S oxidoreductase